jgi:hypothetical protein
MTLRTTIIITICSLAWQGAFSQSSSPETGKLFAGCRYHYQLSKTDVPGDWLEWWAKTTTNTSAEVIYRGTFWAACASNGRVYVTAAHVLGIKLQLGGALDGHQIDNDKLKITGRTVRAYMGTLGYEVGRVGQVGFLSDVAFIEPKRERLADDIACMTLATNAPRADEEVRVVGYPGTPYQQIEKAIISSVHERQRFLVLNRPVDPGFSGGPVINSEGQVYGVIANTDAEKKQTTVIRLSEADIPSIQWVRIEDLP